MKLLSEEILRIRKEHKLTQQEFADRIYVTRQAVSKWECDKAFPSSDVIAKIKEEFNVDLNELISEAELKTTVIKNNSQIKKLKFLNIFLILGVVLFMIVISILFMSFNVSKKNIKLTLYPDLYYAEWEKIDGVDYYNVVIDDTVIKKLSLNRFAFSYDDIIGDVGSNHNIRIDAYKIDDKENKKIACSDNISFKKHEQTTYSDINDIYNNTYFLNENCQQRIDFESKIYGLFKINIYFDDSDIPYTGSKKFKYLDSNTSQGRILYNRDDGEYYFHFKMKYKTFDEDGEVIYPNPYSQAFTIQFYGVEFTYRKFRIEFVPEQMYIKSPNEAITTTMDTLKNAYDISNKDYTPILNTIYEINTEFSMNNCMLKINFEDSRFRGAEIIIFDENNNIILEETNEEYLKEYYLFIPSNNKKRTKIYICINILYVNSIPDDVDIIFNIY